MYREMQEHLYKMLEVMKNIGYSESVVDHYRHYVLAFIEFFYENELDLSEKSLSQYSNWLDSLDLLNNNQLRARKSASNRFLLFFETGYFTRRAPMLQKFLRAHSGFNRDELNDYLNLFAFITNPPSDKLEKIDILLNLAFHSAVSLKYREYFRRKTNNNKP